MDNHKMFNFLSIDIAYMVIKPDSEPGKVIILYVQLIAQLKVSPKCIMNQGPRQ